MDVEEEDDVTPKPSTRGIQPAKAYELPFSKTPLFAIEHPAILSSIEAGIKSLGGPSALSNVPARHCVCLQSGT